MRKAAAGVAACAAMLGGVALLCAAASPAAAQEDEAAKIMARVRTALGGSKLDALKSLAVEGRALRSNAAGNTVESEFEMATELPDKFVRKDTLAALGNMSVYRTSGFNGDGVINEIDTPPQLAGGGHVVMRMVGPGQGSVGQQPSPEQQEAMRQGLLRNAKREYARMMLGMIGASPAFPLTFTYAGVAESPEGKAHVIDVTGEGDFAARLFVDSQTSLPLMLSWMDKEPMQVRVAGPGGAGGGGGAVSHGAAWVGSGGAVSFSTGGGGGVQAGRGAAPATPEEMAKLEEQVKAAEAARRTVEYRVYYSDFQQVDGVTLPHRLQRSIDGEPTEEVVFERVKVNPKIDAKKFAVSK